METFRPLSILLSQTVSHVAMVVPLYSTFVLDSATVGYFLLLHDIAPLSGVQTNPEVDCLSASMYPLRQIDNADL